MSDTVVQSCASCVWFNQGAPSIAGAERRAESAGAIGTCQLKPPVVVPTPHFAVSMFPETRDDRWCGMWESVFSDPDDGDREDRPEDKVVHLGERRAA